MTITVSPSGFDTLGTIIANMGSTGLRASLMPTELNRVYHLVKPEVADGDEAGPYQGAKIMSEVFLTRLLSTKVRREAWERTLEQVPMKPF